MQLFSRKKALLAATLGALSVLGACGDDVTVAPPPPAVLSITPPSASLNIGESATFVVQISGGGTPAPTVTACSSSAAAVATATLQGSTCRVTAVSAGNATITATASTGAQIAAQVTVTAQNPAISGLTVSPTTANLAVSQSVTLVPNVTRAAAGNTVTYSYQSSTPSVATVTAAGVVTAVAPGVATITVTANGSGTGYASTTLTTAATINVAVLPPAISALNVQPTSLSLAVGSTAPLTSSATQPTGAAAATITYGSSNPAVATVNQTTGVVTAIAPGTATITVTAQAPANAQFAAQSVTQLVPVSVAQAAAVTIQSVTQGPIATSLIDLTDGSGARQAGIVSAANPQVGQPIDITNVRDQIQVIVNLQTNGQRVDSVVAFIANADGTNRRPAARQLYSNGQANTGDITLFVNTADFTADFTAGTANVLYPNGQKVISASVFTTSPTGTAVEIQNAANNRQTVNFNNYDGWAIQYVNPTRVAVNPTNGLNWWGGPGTEGTGSATVVPVFYTPGRTVQRVTLGMRQGLDFTVDICNSTGLTLANRTGQGVSQETLTAGPFRVTYNDALGRMTASGSTTFPVTNFSTTGNGNIECYGYEHPAVQAQNILGVIMGVDNQNNPTPVVTFANGYRFSTSVVRPTNNRLDYFGPNVEPTDIRRASPAVTGWVNASFNFNDVADVVDILGGLASDNGVGSTRTRTFYYQSNFTTNGSGSTVTGTFCGDTTWVAMPTGTGADIPECATNLVGGWDGTLGTTRANAPYRVLYTEADRLGNIRIAARSAPFGVDKTRPLIRFSAASRADTTVVDALSSTTSFQAEFIDERSGFVDGTELTGTATFPAPTLNLSSGAQSFLAATVRPQNHYATRGAGELANFVQGGASIGSARSICVNPNALTTALTNTNGSIQTGGATWHTMPTGCSFSNPTTALNIGQTADGWRIGHPAQLETSVGIYKYVTRAVDRAGNPSDTARRALAVDAGAPSVADIGLPLTISANANPTVNVTGQDNVEVRAYGRATLYPDWSASPLRYPQALADRRYNDSINSPVLNVPATALPTGTPYILGVTGTASAIPSIAQQIGVSLFDVANRTQAGGITFTGNVPSQAIATGSNFNSFNNDPAVSGGFATGQVSQWIVVPTRAAQNNAPEGLKAQLITSTNVTSPVFQRVDFFRFVAAGVDPTYTTAHWAYLGSVNTPATADVGTSTVSRAFTWTLPDANYASTPTSFETKQAPAAFGEQILAIGVRANGAGLATSGTIGGTALGFTVNFAGTPAGQTAPAGNITITGPNGFTTTVTGTSTIVIPGTGTYTITANPATNSAGTQYVCTPTPQTIIINSANSTTPVPTITCTAQVFAGNVAVTGLAGSSTVPVTLTGTGAATGIVGQANLGNTAGSLVPVAIAGTYTVTAPATVTSGGLTYSLTSISTSPIVVGNTPAGAAQTTITYAVTSNYTNVNVVNNTGVAGFTGFTVTTGGTPGSVTTLGTTQFTQGAAGATNVTANTVTINGITYGATVVQGTANTTGGTTVTVTYSPAQLTLSATGTNSTTGNVNPSLWNLVPVTVTGPNGFSQTVTPTVQVNGATQVVVLPIASPGQGSYQVSYPNTFTIGSATFTSNCASLAGGNILTATVVGNECRLTVNAQFGNTVIAPAYTAP